MINGYSIFNGTKYSTDDGSKNYLSFQPGNVIDGLLFKARRNKF